MNSRATIPPPLNFDTLSNHEFITPAAMGGYGNNATGNGGGFCPQAEHPQQQQPFQNGMYDSRGLGFDPSRMFGGGGVYHEPTSPFGQRDLSKEASPTGFKHANDSSLCQPWMGGGQDCNAALWGAFNY